MMGRLVFWFAALVLSVITTGRTVCGMNLFPGNWNTFDSETTTPRASAPCLQFIDSRPPDSTCIFDLRTCDWNCDPRVERRGSLDIGRSLDRTNGVYETRPKNHLP